MDWVIGLSSRQRFFGSFASSVHMRGCVYMSMFDVQKSGGGRVEFYVKYGDSVCLGYIGLITVGVKWVIIAGLLSSSFRACAQVNWLEFWREAYI